MVITKPLEMSKLSFETFLAEKGSPLILVMDKDALRRALLCLEMETEGYRVIEASNAYHCLEAYKLFHPNLVILNGMMPEIDGLTCCRELRALPNTEHTPVLIITNLDDSEAIAQAFAAGATDYISQPMSLTLLRQRVRQLIQRTELCRQLEQLNTDIKRQRQKRTVQLQKHSRQLVLNWRRRYHPRCGQRLGFRG